MISVIQRVKKALVRVDDQIIGQINHGILSLVAIEPNDSEQQIEKLAKRILNYRIFADTQDRMNLSLLDINGGLLVVPQFTLAADTNNGNRPSFSSSAKPEQAKLMFEKLVVRLSKDHPVETGRFGADMQVELINDGPVTFILNS